MSRLASRSIGALLLILQLGIVRGDDRSYYAARRMG